MFENFKRNNARSIALVRIGNSLNYLSVQIKNLLRIIEHSNYNVEEVNTTILYLFYYSNIEVIEKMDEFECPLTHKLIIPDIGGNFTWITIGHAFSQTIAKINVLAVQMGLQNEIQEILDEGPLYEEMGEFYAQVLRDSKN